MEHHHLVAAVQGEIHSHHDTGERRHDGILFRHLQTHGTRFPEPQTVFHHLAAGRCQEGDGGVLDTQGGIDAETLPLFVGLAERLLPCAGIHQQRVAETHHRRVILHDGISTRTRILQDGRHVRQIGCTQFVLLLQRVETHRQIDHLAALRHVQIARQILTQGCLHHNQNGQQGGQKRQQEAQQSHHPYRHAERKNDLVLTFVTHREPVGARLGQFLRHVLFVSVGIFSHSL